MTERKEMIREDIISTGESLTFHYEPKLYINVYGTEYPLTEKQVHKLFEGLYSGEYDKLSVEEFRKIVNEIEHKLPGETNK